MRCVRWRCSLHAVRGLLFGVCWLFGVKYCLWFGVSCLLLFVVVVRCLRFDV